MFINFWHWYQTKEREKHTEIDKSCSNWSIQTSKLKRIQNVLIWLKIVEGHVRGRSAGTERHDFGWSYFDWPVVTCNLRRCGYLIFPAIDWMNSVTSQINLSSFYLFFFWLKIINEDFNNFKRVLRKWALRSFGYALVERSKVNMRTEDHGVLYRYFSGIRLQLNNHETD